MMSHCCLLAKELKQPAPRVAAGLECYQRPVGGTHLYNTGGYLPFYLKLSPAKSL